MEQIRFDKTKWKVVQIPVRPAIYEKLQQWCASRYVSMAGWGRLVINKQLWNCATFPGYKQEALEEIEAAVEDVQKFFPHEDNNNGRLQKRKFYLETV